MQKLFSLASDYSRTRKFELFFAELGQSSMPLILDLGGEAPSKHQPGKQLCEVFAHPDRIVLVNLFWQNVRNAVATNDSILGVCGDGLMLPFEDKTFDICYCNAVIEHLFNWDNQQRFAAEIRRVARRWFVTTPNRLFPFEPHLRLPFVSWFPQGWQHKIGWRFGYNHVQHRYARGCDRTELRLLTASELRRLFPESRVVVTRVAGVAATLIAIGDEHRSLGY